MLAPCGIDCAECAAYKATMASDEAQRQKVVDTFGEGEGRFADWVCLGCQYPEPGLIADYCAGCGVRACAVERGVASCAVCSEYEGCEKLKAFFAEESGSIAARMQRLREAFLARTQPGP